MEYYAHVASPAVPIEAYTRKTTTGKYYFETRASRPRDLAHNEQILSQLLILKDRCNSELAHTTTRRDMRAKIDRHIQANRWRTPSEERVLLYNRQGDLLGAIGTPSRSPSVVTTSPPPELRLSEAIAGSDTDEEEKHAHAGARGSDSGVVAADAVPAAARAGYGSDHSLEENLRGNRPRARSGATMHVFLAPFDAEAARSAEIPVAPRATSAKHANRRATKLVSDEAWQQTMGWLRTADETPPRASPTA